MKIRTYVTAFAVAAFATGFGLNSAYACAGCGCSPAAAKDDAAVAPVAAAAAQAVDKAAKEEKAVGACCAASIAAGKPACCPAPAAKGATATVKAAVTAVKTGEASTVVYNIEGASCPVGCGAAITKALQSYEGIAKFDLDKKNWLAKVTFKDGEDPEKFVKTFNEGTRYTAKVKTDEK